MYPSDQFDSAGYPAERQRPVGLLVASIVCSAMGVLFIPPLFAGLGIYLGYRVYKHEPRWGQVCMTIGGLALVAGVVLGMLVGLTLFS